MKTEKIKKKLVLKKSTVTNLNFNDLQGIKGGRPDTDRTCGYCDSWVSCEWTLCPVCDSIPDTLCCGTGITCYC